MPEDGCRSCRDSRGEIEGFLGRAASRDPQSRSSSSATANRAAACPTLLPESGECVDDLAFIYGIKVDNNNHGPATMHVNTGSQLQGSASVGSWVTYGLGSANQNLPGYVVIQDPRGAPVNGAVVWGNGYLPAAYQGTLFRSSGSPILDLERPQASSREQQRQEFDLLKRFNEQHLAQRPGASELEARISAYELAFRMQAEAPRMVDLSQGIRGDEADVRAGQSDYRRFRPAVSAGAAAGGERRAAHAAGTHGVEIGRYSWDDHGNIKERIPQHAAEVDQPVAALLKDLKSRGLLEETLVVWASEMGRTPFINDLTGDKPGRDHNQYGLVMWMAGGDVKGGAPLGETDEFGIKALEEPIPMRDVHATILNLMGLDDRRLTYLHAGRFRKLTDIGGSVI